MIDNNNYVTVKAYASLLTHYNQAIDPTKAPYFEDADSDVLVIPQPRIMEENPENDTDK